MQVKKSVSANKKEIKANAARIAKNAEALKAKK